MEKKILLDCRDVSLGYEGTAIWEGLTFQVRSGDYVCIVGENVDQIFQHGEGRLRVSRAAVERRPGAQRRLPVRRG